MTDPAALKREQARLRKARWRAANRERDRQHDKLAKGRLRARKRAQKELWRKDPSTLATTRPDAVDAHKARWRKDPQVMAAIRLGAATMRVHPPPASRALFLAAMGLPAPA